MTERVKKRRGRVETAPLFANAAVLALSPRLAWLKNHNVRTHEFTEQEGSPRTYNHLGFGRWIAYVGKSVPPHEDSDRIWSTGDTEDAALVNLAKGRGWMLWNEEAAADRPLNSVPLKKP